MYTLLERLYIVNPYRQYRIGNPLTWIVLCCIGISCFLIAVTTAGGVIGQELRLFCKKRITL